MIRLSIRNISKINIKKMCSRRELERILSKIEVGENLQKGKYALDLIFCGEEFIRELNKTYRDKNEATDVLSFSFPEDLPQVCEEKLLGEIYISLETVINRNEGDLGKVKAEVKLLFCHGVLHLLGYTHDNALERKRMIRKQSEYLGIPLSEAWIKYPKKTKEVSR